MQVTVCLLLFPRFSLFILFFCLWQFTNWMTTLCESGKKTLKMNMIKFSQHPTETRDDNDWRQVDDVEFIVVASQVINFTNEIFVRTKTQVFPVAQIYS